MRQLEPRLIATPPFWRIKEFHIKEIAGREESPQMKCAGMRKRRKISRNLGKTIHLNTVRIKRSAGWFPSPRSTWSQRQAASPESGPTARRDEAARTPSVLSGFQMVCPSAQKIFRSPGRKVRAYYLPDRPIRGNVSRLRRACIWSSWANRLT